MATTGTVHEAEKKVRQRSPNYPTVGLEEALERVGRLFREDGRAGAPTEIAAKHIGYATAHGQAYSVLSALKKFGLLDEGKGRVSPSQRTLELLNLPIGDPRRKQALKDAALSPPIYRELVEQHSNTGLPGDEALEAELVTYKNFNPKAVAGFVKDFRATLEFAGLSDFSMLGSGLQVEKQREKPKIGDFVQWEHNGVLGFPEGKRLVKFSDDGKFAFVEGYATGLPVEEVIPAETPAHTQKTPLVVRQVRVQGATMRQDVFSVTEGDVVLSWPTPLSEDSIQDLKDWLRIVERKIVRSTKAAEITDEPTP